MKKTFFLFLVPLLCILYSCNDNTIVETINYKINEPVFMSADAFRKSLKVTKDIKEITGHGKICFYNGYLYISQPEVGVHIIDNRNPKNPKKIGFIELLGNADLAIRNNLLYADAFIDLVWFDITDPVNPEPKGRLENVFSRTLPICDNGYGYDYAMAYPSENKGIVVGWNVVERTQTIEYSQNPNYIEDMVTFPGMSNGGSGNGGSTGVNGSMSRFSLYQNYMYVVLNSQMTIFDLKGEQPVIAVENVYVDQNVETIFSYKDCMFLGTPRGMSIYSVKDPLKPERQSTIWHVYGCDPVVVENDIAYVTVHSGNFCGQNNNELLIIDVSDVKSPRPIVSYAMTKPKGLGIDNGTLFICDDGLKIFNAAKPQELMANRLAHYSGMEGYDVIPYNDVLMMIAEDGLYQYDYSDVKAISQLSKLEIKK